MTDLDDLRTRAEQVARRWRGVTLPQMRESGATWIGMNIEDLELVLDLLDAQSAALTQLRTERDQMCAEITELLAILDARAHLEAGYRGMGVNILTEKAQRLTSQCRRMKALLASQPPQEG